MEKPHEDTDDPRPRGHGLRRRHGPAEPGADEIRLALVLGADRVRRPEPVPGRVHRLLPRRHGDEAARHRSRRRRRGLRSLSGVMAPATMRMRATFAVMALATLLAACGSSPAG